MCYWKKLSELEDTTENENELRSGRNRGELDMANEVSEHQKVTGLFKTVDDAEVSKTCQNVTHTQPRTNVTLEYLEGFTGYFIQVSAFNSRGIGPKSEAPEAETDIGSTHCHSLNFDLYLCFLKVAGMFSVNNPG